jgi:hypothetical protein
MSNHSIINQNNSTIKGNHNVINGHNNTIIGNHNVINGHNNNINGNHNIVNGDNNNINGNHNIESGLYNKLNGTNQSNIQSNNSKYSNISIGSNISGGIVTVNGRNINDINRNNTLLDTNDNNIFTVNGQSIDNNTLINTSNNNINNTLLNSSNSNSYDSHEKKSKINNGKDKDEIEEDPDKACIICFTNKKRCAAIPCGHFMSCISCAIELEKKNICPTCREPVDFFNIMYV